MTIFGLLREAFASAWAARVPSVLLAIVAGAMCSVALTTVGQSAANEAKVQGQLDAAGARMLSVSDVGEEGFINDRTLTGITELSTVQTAIGSGDVFDAVNGALGDGSPGVTVWPVQGQISAACRLVRGRLPLPGEAMVSQTALRQLGLAAPVGYLQGQDGQQYPIVGQFEAVPPFTDYDAGVVVHAGEDLQLVKVVVVIRSLSAVPATQRSVLSIMAPVDPASVRLESPSGLAALTQTVGGQVQQYGRTVLLLILGTGGVFVASVVLSDVLIRRRDLGRRRTLGATRSTLVLLVTVRAVLPATVGTVLASLAAGIVNVKLGYTTPIDFIVAVSLLTVLMSAVSAFVPALYASRLDPAQIMRTP